MSDTLRRVITGMDEGGESCVLLDAIVTRGRPEPVGVANLWSAGPVPVDNALPLDSGLKPFDPAQLAEVGLGFMLIEFAPGMGREDPGMHATNTTDHFVVVEGAIVLVLDKEEVTLRRGDTGVLRGVRHGWRNDTAETTVLVTTSAPARPLIV